jgi:hypothetical protein
LKDTCLFVDARDFETGKRYPETIPHPHIFDQESGTYLPLNDTAAFIAHFILMGVQIDLVPQILQSEYGERVENPDTEVSRVLELLHSYIEPRVYFPEYVAARAGEVQEHKGCYPLDFGVYSIATVTVKLPPYQIPRR